MDPRASLTLWWADLPMAGLPKSHEAADAEWLTGCLAGYSTVPGGIWARSYAKVSF